MKCRAKYAVKPWASRKLRKRGVVARLLARRRRAARWKRGISREHPQVRRPARLRQVGNSPAGPERTGPLQAGGVVAGRHRHLGVLGGHPELGEHPQQRRVGPFVVHDEAGVDGEHTVRAVDVVGVGVTAEPVVGLVQGDAHRLVAGRDVRRGQPGDAGADHGEPPCVDRRPSSGRLEVEQRDDLRGLLGTAVRLEAHAGADGVVGVTLEQGGGRRSRASALPRPCPRTASAARAGRPCPSGGGGMSSVTSTARCSLAERTMVAVAPLGSSSVYRLRRRGLRAPGRRRVSVVDVSSLPRLPDSASDADQGEDDRRHQRGKPPPAVNRTPGRDRRQGPDTGDVARARRRAARGRGRGRRRRPARPTSHAGSRPPHGRWGSRPGDARSWLARCRRPRPRRTHRTARGCHSCRSPPTPSASLNRISPSRIRVLAVPTGRSSIVATSVCV